ncbi:MAG: hypothetical protein ACR2I1_08660 [Propionibacteriaceae bacterium]
MALVAVSRCTGHDHVRLCGALSSRAADRLVAMLRERIGADDARIVLHLAGLADVESGALPPILELRRALADRSGCLLIADASPAATRLLALFRPQVARVGRSGGPCLVTVSRRTGERPGG